MKNLLIVSFIAMISCNSYTEIERYSVAGYRVGDTIDGGIIITDDTPQNHESRGIIEGVPCSRVRLFNNLLELIVVDSLTPAETDTIINDVLKIHENRSWGDSCLVIRDYSPDEELFFLFDTITDDLIQISRSTSHNPDSIATLYLSSGFKFNKIRDSILGPPEYDFTPMKEK